MEINITENLFKTLCNKSTTRGQGKSIDLPRFNNDIDHQFLPKLVNMNRVKTIFGETNRCLFCFCTEKDRKLVRELLDISDDDMSSIKFSS
jgi:hypothetical protein